MGYATVMNVPRVSTHAQAMQIFKDTKPIRGTTTVPLGARRDHYQYSIRKDGENIQLFCYKTPVVTFHPDDSITIRTDGWCSVSTHQFIQQVTGIPTNGRGRYTVLSLRDSKVAISGNETASLVMRSGNWCCVSDHRRVSYRMNRKAANNVRARYKDFIHYINGFSLIRGEFVNGEYGRDGYVAINFSYDELEAVLEKDKDGEVVWRGTSGLMKRHDKKYTGRALELIEWVTSGDHEQYLKAAVSLYAHESLNYVQDPYKVVQRYYNPLRRRADLGPKNFDEFILRWHAEEVLEQCETKPNAVPNTRYDGWLDPKGGI